MRIVEYLKCHCPHCRTTRHRVVSNKRRGCVVVRYHQCKCGRSFVSHETAKGATVVSK